MRRAVWPPTLRATIIAGIVLATILASAATATAVLVSARSIIYETRQNQLLTSFRDDANAVFDRISTQAPQVQWDYEAAALPGRSLLIDLDSDRIAGDLQESDLPAGIIVALTDRSQETRFLRGSLDGDEVFFVATTSTDLTSDPGSAIGVVTAYSLEPQRAQVADIIARGVVAAVAALTVAAALGWLIGSLLARPLSRLKIAAEQLGTSSPPSVPGSVFRDIDELGQALQRSADELSESNNELRRREGHARRLVSDVAHELRTPLTSMMAVSEILEDLDGSTPQERATAAAVTARGTQRLAKLVAELLDMARIDAGVAATRPQDVQLIELLRSSISIHAEAAAIELHCAENLRIETDPERLRKIVDNLVSNALRHGKPPVQVRAAAHSGAIEITVTDDGPGVPEDQRDRIFERFVMLNGAREESSGLGLAIARDNAQLLGGSLRLHDSQRGASFTLRVPLTSP